MLSEQQFHQIKQYTDYSEYLIDLIVELDSKSSGSFTDVNTLCIETAILRLKKLKGLETVEEVLAFIEKAKSIKLFTGWLSPAFAIYS
jgi:hypothetical protein